MNQPSTQSPVVEKIIESFANELKGCEEISEDALDKLVFTMLESSSPTAARLGAAMFNDQDEKQS